MTTARSRFEDELLLAYKQQQDKTDSTAEQLLLEGVVIDKTKFLILFEEESATSVKIRLISARNLLNAENVK